MSTLLKRIDQRIRSRGVRKAFGYLRHRLSECYEEKRRGVRTGGKVSLSAMGIHDPACKPYAPTAYRSFREAMRGVSVGPDDVFLDYGVGKGRVVILAAERPFRRVSGVEISPELSVQARENLRRAGRRLICRDIEIVTADAAGYVLPDEATVLHFFDPFKDGILAAVVGQIRDSLQRRPRTITILYADPHHFESLLEHEPWIVKHAAVPYPFADAPARSIHHEYGIYRARL